MLKIYKYLYYRLYSWNFKLRGEKDIPEYNAAFGVAALMGIQFSTVMIFIDLFFIILYNTKDFLPNIPKSIYVSSMIIFIIINYFWFVHKKRYLKIVEEYKQETKKIRLKKLLILWVVVLAHIFIIFILANIRKHYLS